MPNLALSVASFSNSDLSIPVAWLRAANGAHAGRELVLPGLDELLWVALLEGGDEVGGVGHDVLRLQVLGNLSRGTAVRHGERDVLVPGTAVVLAFEQTERGPQDGHDHDQSRDEQRDRRGQGRARTHLAPLPLFRPVALSVTGAGLPRLSAHEFSPLTNSLRPPFMVHMWGAAGQDHRPHGQL